jgi:hypothetical protein
LNDVWENPYDDESSNENFQLELEVLLQSFWIGLAEVEHPFLLEPCATKVMQLSKIALTHFHPLKQPMNLFVCLLSLLGFPASEKVPRLSIVKQ